MATGSRRVLLVCNALGVGGTERNVMLYARELTRLGHEVRIHALVPGGGLEPECSAWLAHEAGGGSSPEEVEARLLAHIRGWAPQIVHALGSPAEFLAGAVVLRTPGPRFVLALQDRIPTRNREASWAMRWACGIADLVVPDGEGTRSQALEEFGSPPARTRTLVDGVDVHGLAGRQPREQTRMSLGAGTGDLLAGMVARLDLPKKGQDVLLDAIARVHTPHTKFVLVGDGPAATALQRQAAALAITDRVTFAGTRTDLGDVIEALDVAILSSRWESIPKVLLEKLALGRAVVTTDAGDIREVVHHEQNALVVPAGDAAALAAALERVLTDAALRDRLGATARASVEAQGLTLTATTARLSEWYASLLEEPARRAARGMAARAADLVGVALARRILRFAYPYMLRSVAPAPVEVSR